MKRSIILIIFISLFLFMTTGCVSENSGDQILSAADSAYAQGEEEVTQGNYLSAEADFRTAYSLYNKSGDSVMARKARDNWFRANRSYCEFIYTQSSAEIAMQEKVPGISDESIQNWLDHSAQKFETDGKLLYFEDVGSNYLYAHPDVLQTISTVLNFSYISRYSSSGKMPQADTHYVNPVRYEGTETLHLTKAFLPTTGTMQIWFPLPVETASQNGIVISNLTHEEYISKGPITEGPIGYLYYEIPCEDVTGDLTLSADIAFTSYEQIFDVDPNLVGEYNTSDPDYLLYTQSSRNIEVNDEIRQKAQEIVGSETNPYLQAQKLYWYILETYPYSLVPHASLDTVEPKVAESTYMFEVGHGDCGTQSMLFSAFCRSLGIPARSLGGYQMIVTGNPGSHFWAEYYIPNYGWIPNDVTVAEIGDWVNISEEEREQFKSFYSSNLDPARFIIQKETDASMSPPIPDDSVVFRLARQGPAILSETGVIDLDLISKKLYQVKLTAVEE